MPACVCVCVSVVFSYDRLMRLGIWLCVLTLTDIEACAAETCSPQALFAFALYARHTTLPHLIPAAKFLLRFYFQVFQGFRCRFFFVVAVVVILNFEIFNMKHYFKHNGITKRAYMHTSGIYTLIHTYLYLYIVTYVCIYIRLSTLFCPKGQ